MNTQKLRFTLTKNYIFAEGNPYEILNGFRDSKKIPALIELQCKEHHVVPGEFDKDAKLDGFVFTDSKGEKYENQFPVAADSLISDHVVDKFIARGDGSHYKHYFNVKKLIDDLVNESKNDIQLGVLVTELSKKLAEQFNIAILFNKKGLNTTGIQRSDVLLIPHVKHEQKV